MSPLYLIAFGDSKAAGQLCCEAAGGYRNELVANMEALGYWSSVEFYGAIGYGGATTAVAAANVDSFLATLTDSTKAPTFVLYNLGSNDINSVGGSLTEAAWLASTNYILNAFRVKWPDVVVLMMRPIVSDAPTGTNTLCDSWIADVVAQHPGWVFLGPDERTFLPGHLADATHPDATGYSLTAAEWQTAMGY